jgi:dimethylargininase
MFKTAITRKPGKNFYQGITTANFGEPSYQRILEQHADYVEILKKLGLQVIELAVLPEYPDAYFVEDVAVVTPDVAVITNPGAKTRNGEQAHIKPVLRRYRKIARIEPPGTLDGGDVLMVGNHFFIGISERTNFHGAAQLGEILEGYGYTWNSVPVGDGLHLKSHVSWVSQNTLLIGTPFIGKPQFDDFDQLEVDIDESHACNTLWINDTLLTPKGFPKTREQLERLGLPIIELSTSEFNKMDGGLSCLSIRF